MKAILPLLFLSALTLSAQLSPEVLHVMHGADPTLPQYDLLPLEDFTGLGAGFGEVVLGRIDPNSVDPSLSGVELPILASVTGSTTAQSINVSTTAGMAVVGAISPYLIIDAGLSSQEVLLVQSIVDSTHFMAIARNNHTAGTSTVRRIFSSYSKYLSTFYTALSMTGVTNVGFIQKDAFPAKVFTQYRTFSSTGTCSPVFGDDFVPWSVDASHPALPFVPLYSASSLSATGNPTNAASLLAGPLTTNGYYVPCVQVQFLFSTEPAIPISPVFRYYWDY